MFSHLSGSEDRERFTYVPGQFAEVSVFGKGEAPFGMASTPTRPERLEFSVSTIGVVTGALHNMEKGEIVGVRGPLGNGYPLEAFKGKNLLLIGGGFGFSTLRSLTNYILHEENRKAYGNLTVIYGARKPGLLLYKEDLEAWRQRADLQVHLTVDRRRKDGRAMSAWCPMWCDPWRRAPKTPWPWSAGPRS